MAKHEVVSYTIVDMNKILTVTIGSRGLFWGVTAAGSSCLVSILSKQRSCNGNRTGSPSPFAANQI